MKLVIADRIPESIEDLKFIIKQDRPDWQLSFIDLNQDGLAILGSINPPDVIILGMDNVDARLTVLL